MAEQADTAAATARYKGVRKRKWGKWVSEVRLPNSRERIWLGSYDSPEKAARAFDAGSFLLRGKRATLNFPDRAHEIAIYCSRRNPSPQQIQSAAARYAHAETQEPSQPSQPVLQAAEDSATPPPPTTTPPPPNQWEFFEPWTAPAFTGIDEFNYDLFHHEAQLGHEMDLDVENDWDSPRISSLWNF